MQNLVKIRKAQIDDMLRRDESARGKLHTVVFDNTIYICGWVFDKRYKTGIRHQGFWSTPICKEANWDVQWHFICRLVEGNLPGVAPINFSKLAYMAPI